MPCWPLPSGSTWSCVSSREMAQPPPQPLSEPVTRVSRGASRSPWGGFLGGPARGDGGRAGGWTGASCCGPGVTLHCRDTAESRVRPGRVLQAQRDGAQCLHGRGRRPLLHQRYLAARVRHLPWDPGPPWEPPGLLGGGPRHPAASLSLLPHGPALPPGLGMLGSHVEIWGGFILSIQWTPCGV